MIDLVFAIYNGYKANKIDKFYYLNKNAKDQKEDAALSEESLTPARIWASPESGKQYIKIVWYDVAICRESWDWADH